jgi:hypothetical protein
MGLLKVLGLVVGLGVGVEEGFRLEGRAFFDVYVVPGKVLGLNTMVAILRQFNSRQILRGGGWKHILVV